MYEDRTLAVFLCMHRTGSSLTANVMQRLGMSLGPFELIGAAESNKYGHFEALDFHALDRTLQTTALGFPDDLPDSAEVLREFCSRDGQWRPEVSFPEEVFRHGEELLATLIQSGPISGFKDPRALLLWPFWSQLLPRFPGLRVVPLFLVRSPHEIAMSIFMRAKGKMAYEDVLEATAVHFRRMQAIRAQWPGPSAALRFDPRVYKADLRRAAELCGLVWSDEIFAQVYDCGCRHHEAAVVAHPAQEAFELLAEALPRGSESSNLQRLQEDAARREALLRTEALELRQQNQWQAAELRAQTVTSPGEQIERLRGEKGRYIEVLQQCGRYIKYLEWENGRHFEALQQCGQYIQYLEPENRRYFEVLQQCEQYIKYLQWENGRYFEGLQQCGQHIQQCEQHIQQLGREKQQYTAALGQLEGDRDRLEQENQRHALALQECDEQLAGLRQQTLLQAGQLGRTESEIRSLRQQSERLQAELRLVKQSRTWRLRQMVVTRLRRSA